MAEFYEVHRDRIDNAMKNFASRKGEYFYIALIEPRQMVDMRGPLFATECRKTETARFVRTEDGCRPAYDGDIETVEAWQERHRDTAPEEFASANPWGNQFAPIPDSYE